MVRRCMIISSAAGLLCLLLSGCYRGSPVKLELEKPAPTFPFNGMGLVPDTLTLSWSPSAWATSYNVQVATDFDFSAIIDSAVCTSTFLAIASPLADKTTYFWRVSSSDGQETSEWSPVYSFTTGVSAPEPLSPEDKAIWIPETLTVAWSASAGALMYYVQVSTDTGFSAFALDDSAGSAFYPVTSPLAQSTHYYWRVSVMNRQGKSGWSETHEFTTVDSLPAPALLSPADGAAGVSLADSLAWDTIQSQWASYRVQVSTSADFSANVVIDTTVPPSSSSAPVTMLSPSTLYWRVAARLFLDGFRDRQGAWSEIRSFTTQ
ncbi:MAG: hypothetical protein JW699_03220 [Chitinispirillaceae bacterium]|nr:hypothetical protein [Chitinispirillaceae bacterium]